MKTVKELKKFISNLPDDMEVGGIGYYGELLDCHSFSVEHANENGAFSPKQKLVDILHIDIEDAGEEPD